MWRRASDTLKCTLKFAQAVDIDVHHYWQLALALDDLFDAVWWNWEDAWLDDDMVSTERIRGMQRNQMDLDWMGWGGIVRGEEEGGMGWDWDGVGLGWDGMG